jgi:hypothetical protein
MFSVATMDRNPRVLRCGTSRAVRGICVPCIHVLAVGSLNTRLPMVLRHKLGVWTLMPSACWYLDREQRIRVDEFKDDPRITMTV